MPVTSGNYNFQSIEVELLIREAFERIGILGEFVEPQKLESAKRSINFLLLDWMDKSINLWTLKGEYQGLVTGQRQYVLSNTVSDIIQVNLRTSSRQLNGVAQTNTGNTYDNGGGGNPQDAFDGNPNTSCIQNVADGNISYDYGVGNTGYITFVGITSAALLSYEIIIESCPLDPTDIASWKPLLFVPAFEYPVGIPVFYDIPTPVNARAYRIRAAAQSDDLNLTEIYFNNNTFDFALSNVSRYEYNTYPNKYLQSRPSVYYLDRQLAPILNIWPTPSSQYNCLFYSYKKMIQDVGLYTNSLEIPARLYPSLVWGLTWQLALKFKPEMAEMLESKYERSFASATTEDSEDVNISIKGE